MAQSPLEQFVIKPIIDINVGGYDLSFTQSSLWMVIGVITATSLMTLAVRGKAIVPGRWQNVAEMLYERYKDMHLSGDRVFPLKGTYNTLNMSLRHVARHAGLSFNPTIHLARHTFATTVTLTQGVPLETVSKMLGHKQITTTQIYAKITNDKIGQDMAALSEKLSSVFKVAR